ncbi:hypothetical protein [uncultured Pedobacter sp.]|uniref:hypothetical protein n=1 Tax=uncultured Pedobacter sp. TaxID=246139 RepID=UPI00263954A3|nr:hypothetical protein [uncultured Pedobacter sp.]
MTEENYEYLKNQVKFTGFGDVLSDVLKVEMQKGEPTFTLEHIPKFDNAELKATLHFRKSEETGMVFFNKFELEVKERLGQMKQTFFVGKNNNYTLKEAYNLMCGRSVRKEFVKNNKDENAEVHQAEPEKFKAWMSMDFTKQDKYGNYELHPYGENYGFDLEGVLSKHKIVEYANPDLRDSLIQSLEKGNRQAITLVLDGVEQRAFVQANPQFKAVKLFDEKGVEIRQNFSQNKKKEQMRSKTEKVENSQKSKRKTGKSQKAG